MALGVDALQDWLGDSPENVARDLREFTESAAILSADRKLVEKHSQKWVGVFGGEVRAAADDLSSLLHELDELGVPRSSTVVRFMEKEPRTLILHHAAG